MQRCLLFAIVFLIAGCNNTFVTHSWKSENYFSKKYKNILVIALSALKDRTLREELENHVVNHLQTMQVEAIPSIQCYGPKKFERIQEDSILNLIEKDGLEGILTIAILNKKKEKYYVPGRVYYTPYFIYHNHFRSYYNTIYERIEEPGYYAETTDYFFETNVYDIETKNLIYSSQSKSFNPSSIHALAKSYSKSIIIDLVNKGIL